MMDGATQIISTCAGASAHCLLLACRMLHGSCIHGRSCANEHHLSLVTLRRAFASAPACRETLARKHTRLSQHG